MQEASRGKDTILELNGRKNRSRGGGQWMVFIIITFSSSALSSM